MRGEDGGEEEWREGVLFSLPLQFNCSDSSTTSLYLGLPVKGWFWSRNRDETDRERERKKEGRKEGALCPGRRCKCHFKPNESK